MQKHTTELLKLLTKIKMKLKDKNQIFVVVFWYLIGQTYEVWSVTLLISWATPSGPRLNWESSSESVTTARTALLLEYHIFCTALSTDSNGTLRACSSTLYTLPR